MEPESEAAVPNQQEEELPPLPMKGVTEPLDTDVLCGRGGAALRHPGNKTYRTLVQLNKGLYITCIKSEKLKISKSIVAAIREQRGRFLEKNKDGTWDDIGEKKAVEKTSQALREGQPKLKRQIAELGGSAAAAMAQNQGYSAPPAALAPQPRANSYSSADGSLAAAAVAFAANEYAQYETASQQPPVLDEATATAFQHHSFLQNNLNPAMNPVSPNTEAAMHSSTLSAEAMPPPPNHQMPPTDILQQLSISNIQEEVEPAVNRMRPSMLQRGSWIAHELGVDPQSTRSLLSEFSSYGMNESIMNMDTASRRSLIGLDLTCPDYSISPPTSSDQRGGESPKSSSPTPMDRRRFFAKMKYARPASGRMNASSGRAGMMTGSSARTFGDFHMVDSQMSLYSNMSSIGDAEAEPLESRRSLMSGLSKISDAGDGTNISIFSDLSKKIGNVSTRSMAMSEISNIDDLDSEDSPDSKPNASSSPPQPMTSTSMEFE